MKNLIVTDAAAIDSIISGQQGAPAGEQQTAERAPVAGSGDPVSSFVSEYLPLAERVGKQLGVEPHLLLGQWGLETGWGKSVIPGTNNLGNIKDFSGRGPKAVDNMTGSRDAYRQYASADEFGDDFSGLLGNLSRYRGALGAGGDADTYFSELKRGGYAEDPDYVTKGKRAAEMAQRAAAAQGGQPRPEPQRGRFTVIDGPASAGTGQERGFAGAVRDNALGLAAGVVRGGAMLADTFGADNLVAQGANEIADGLMDMQTPQRKAERANRAELISQADDTGSPWEEIKANIAGFMEAPVETSLSAVGASAPTILALFIPGLNKMLAARLILQAAIGAAQGAGAVKGSIYEAVERKLIEDGVDADTAAKVAAGAQAYDGKNGGQIAIGSILGALAGTLGIERAAASIMSGGAASIARGRAGGAVLGALGEAPLEGAQGGQERFASNTALINEGFEVDPMRGVAGQAAGEAVASAGPGAAFGAMQQPEPPKPGLDEARRKAKEPNSPLSRAAAAGNPQQPPPAGGQTPPGGQDIEKPAYIRSGIEADAFVPREMTPMDVAARQWAGLVGDRDRGPGLAEQRNLQAAQNAGQRWQDIGSTTPEQDLRAQRSADGAGSAWVGGMQDAAAESAGPTSQLSDAPASEIRPANINQITGLDYGSPESELYRAAVRKGFDTIETRGNETWLVNPNTGSGVRLPSPGSLLRARKAVQDYVRERADEAATSPNNDLRQPTDAQKKAGNYPKGHLRLNGFDIAIENPRDSVRSGTAPDGSRWETKMAHDYGYIKRTTGADNDQVDVFVGPRPDAKTIFVVDQVDPATGLFDESKALFGFRSMLEAREGYLSNYEPGWQGLGSIVEMSPDQFRQWVNTGNARQPASDFVAGARRVRRPNRFRVNTAEEARATSDLSERLGQPISLADSSREDARALNALLDAWANLTGRRGIAVQDASFDGVQAGDHFFVNVDRPQMHVAQTIAHEFKHLTERSEPAARLYERIWQMISEDGRKAYYEGYLAKATPGMEPSYDQMMANLGSPDQDVASAARSDLARLKSEMVADFFGRRFNDREWLQKLANQKPALFGDFVKDWIRVLNSLIGRLRSLAGQPEIGIQEKKNVDQYISELEEAKSIAMEAATMWAERHPSLAKRAGIGGDGVLMSSREDDSWEFPEIDDGFMDDEIESMLQAELDAELERSSSPASAEGIDQAELKRVGIMAEQAFGDLYWEDEERTGFTQIARVPDLHREGRVARLQIEQDISGLWRAELIGTWVGPAAAENSGFATEAGVKDFVSRYVASYALSRSGFDIASAVPKAQLDRIVKGWKSIGKIEPGQRSGAFRFGRANEKARTIKEIAEHMGLLDAYNLSVSIDENYPDKSSYVMDFSHKESGKSFQALLEYHKGGQKRYFTANTIELGRSGMGAAVYQLAADFASRRGLSLRPESSISGVNTYRRTEQMISAALRTGKSTAMVPHPTQRIYGFNEDASTEADHDLNLGRLLLASLRNVRELAPEVDELLYFPETDEFAFLDGENANDLVDEMLSRTDARAFGLGRTQLARAVLTQQMLNGDKAPASDELDVPVLYSARLEAEMELQAVRDQYRGTDQWMKAPNGLATKLTERQWLQVRTPSFKRWFGDWEKFAVTQSGVWSDAGGEVSKAVDEQTGEPMVLYHGTSKGGFFRFNGATGERRGELGTFLTPDYEMAMSYVRRGRARDISIPTGRDDLEERGYQFEDLDDGRVRLIDADGYINDAYDSEAAAVAAAIREFPGSNDTPTVYELFANIRSVGAEEDFRGASWNGEFWGDMYEVYSREGDIVTTDDGRDVMNLQDAKALVERVGGIIEQASPLPFTTDSVAREALKRKSDGAIMRNVVDDGGGGGNYYGDPADVFVVFSPSNVKSAEFNTGDFDDGDDIRFSAREQRMTDTIGEFRVRTQKDGSMLVAGDPEAIRSLLPDSIKGRVVSGGIMFTSTDAPSARAAIEGRKLTYSRAGAVLDRKPMKGGKYLGAPEKFNTPAKIPTLRKWLKKLAMEGEPGRHWYENSSREILRMTGGDRTEARKFVALLAIYSPQAKVDANSTFALRAWAQYKAGQEIDVKTEVMDRKAQAAMDNVDAFWSGEKTGNFFFNLLREIDPSTEGKQGATIDMWMMRAGQYGSDAPTAVQYAFMEDETNRLARDLGWEPQQVQAAIWVAMKARMENQGVKQQTEAISEKRGWIRFDRGTKGQKQRVILNEQKHRDNWLRQAFAHDPSIEDTAQAKFDFSDGVLRHIGQISFETRPSRATGILPGIHDAPYKQQTEFHRAVHKALHDDRGVDMLAARLGLLVDNDILAPGVWQGEVSPSTQKLVSMAPAKGPDGRSNVDPEQARLLDVYSAVAGLLVRQDGVGWHRPFFTVSRRDANALDINIGRPLKPREAVDLEVAVGRWMDDAGKDGWRDAFAFISSPNGVRVVNLGAVTNYELHNDIVRVAQRVLPDFDYRLFASSSNLVTNNWKESPDGQGYIQRIRAEGRSDVLDWAASVLAPRVQSVFDDFSARYGWGEPGRVPGWKPGRRGGTRYSGRVLAPLEGAPTVEGAAGPDSRIVQVAESYARSVGINLRRQAEFVEVDIARAQRIAAAYEAMPHAPQDPVVREAYENLIRQTVAQYRALERAGYRFWLFDESNDPYAGNPWNAMRDLRSSQSMGVFATEAGFGSGATEIDVADNPLLVDTGIKWPYGSPEGKLKRVLANDLFRAVHDAFGHGLEGAGFRARGEENAWQAHVRLFTGSAVGAITSETRGQNSWLNYGPNAERNQTAKVEDTIFADQKTGLMPSWTWEEGVVGDMPEDVRLSARAPGELFYSELKRQVDGASMKQAAPGAWKQFIKALAGKGVKADEIEWTGINDWLDLQDGKVSKQAIVDYLGANGVRVEDVVLGSEKKRWVVRVAGDSVTHAFNTFSEADGFVDRQVEDYFERYVDDSMGSREREKLLSEARDRVILYEPGEWDGDGATDARYEEFTLPGGENYREVLLTLPSIGSGTAMREALEAKYPGKIGRELYLSLTPQEKAAWDREMEANKFPGYRSSHWGQPNVLAHIRLNDRTDASGARVLFVEELQSDWAQQGRKNGFGGTGIAGFRYDGQGNEWVRAEDRDATHFGDASGRDDRLFDSRIEAERRLPAGIPLAPFVTKTEGWLNLALKRVMLMAVQEGYDKIAFVTGEQSAERYDLSKRVSEIYHWRDDDGDYGISAYDMDGRAIIDQRTFKGSELEDAVGKEIAERIVRRDGDDAPSRGTGVKRLSGDGLKIGGEGMRAFYDQIVPNAVKALTKRLGGKQEVIDVNVSIDTDVGDVRWLQDGYGYQFVEWDGGSRYFATEAEARSFVDNLNQENSKRSSQPGIAITDEMREKVSGGLPLFSMRFAEAADRAGFDTSKVWYHGTTAKSFRSFRPGKGGFDELGAGIYFTGDPDVAGAWAGSPGDGGRIIPAYLRKGDIYDSTNGVDYMALVRRIRERNPVQDFEREAKRIRSSKSVTEWTPEEAQLINRADAELWRSWLLESDEDLAAQMRRGSINAWLDRAGYIGRINRNSQIYDQVVVFRPESIRAPWSRFNPKKSASADFLASARIDTPEFKDWSDGLPLVLNEGDYQGGPAVFAVYHGTTHGGITTFERTGNKEGFLGQGPYFTTSPQDASENYAGIGPDLRVRIELEAERVSDDMANDPGFAMDVLRRYVDEQGVEVELNEETLDAVDKEHGGDAAMHWATATLKGDNSGFVMPVFVKMANPLDTVNGVLEYQIIEDEDGNILDETGTLVDWVLAAREVAGYRGLDAEVERYIDVLLADGDGAPASRVLSAATEHLIGSYDDNGDPVSPGQIVSEIAEQLGYDGIVMDAGEYFGGKRKWPFGMRSKAMAGVTDGTLHMVPFKANQVKSSIGNSGAFSKESGDIRYSSRSAVDTFDQNQIAAMAVPGYKSREKLIDMPIADFLALARDGNDSSKLAGTRQLLKDRIPFGSLPYLMIDQDGRVDGHEGRHRARALAEQWYTSMPVILRMAGLRWSEQADPDRFDYLETWPQEIRAQDGAVNPDLRLPFPVSRERAMEPYGDMAMMSARMTETPEFKRWFGDSKVVDAEGNRGTFDPANPDIRYSAWDAPAPSRFDDFVYKAQDKLIDLKRVTQSIKKSVGSLAEDVDAYLQEELFHGRAAKRTHDFGVQELQPLMEQIAANGLTIGDVEEYLHARHAKEANRIIAQRNPDEPGLQDGGSGMTDADADAYMAGLPPQQRAKLESVAARVDGIINDTRQLYVTYGLESQATVDGWASMFKHYIPLQREDKDGAGGMSIGQGFSVKGKETKGRTGSKRKVVDILANIAMQRERLIVRGEKNRVAKALVGMVAANPNPGFWQVGPPPAERVYDPKTNTVVERVDPMYRMRNNVVMAKVQDPDGSVREIGVVFNEDNPRAMRLASALKNLDAGHLEGILGVSAKITRYFASINTQYNPVFGVVNLVRDVQGAMVNLSDTPLAGQRARIARDTFGALWGIYGDLRAERSGKPANSQWAQLWDEFQNVGGKTGFRELFRNSQDRANELQKIVNPDGWMDSPWGKVFTANGALKMPVGKAKRAAEGLFDWLSDYNEALENGVRLAAYKAGLDQGMSKKQAASLAKNLTVNFNRRGQIGMQAGAVYAFFNAAMQGTARIGQVLFTMDGADPKTLRLSKAGQKIVYGGLLLGVMQALMLSVAGFDEEDPPPFVRERSLIIPVGGGKYITIPMPLGLHVIPGLGRHMTEFALSGGEKPAERVASILGMLADAFNPIGNAGLSMQTIAPTVIDPLVALTENRDWTGKPIARTSMNPATPGHALYKDTASSWSKMMSEAVNWVTGGNEYVAGVLSPTPDQIDYLIGQLTGGVGREIAKIDQSARALVSGEELPTFKMPLVGRFVGDSQSQASEGTAFYANIRRLNELETEVKGLRGDGRLAEAQSLLAGRPDAYLISVANVAERQIQRLRREKRALVEQGAPRERVREIEQRITEAMGRLNRAVERAEAQRSRS